MHITTSLEKLRMYGPCKDRRRRLLEHLNKEKPDNEPLKFSDILAGNGLDDAFWCLHSIEAAHGMHIRMMFCDIAEALIPVFYPPGEPANQFNMNVVQLRRCLEGAHSYAVDMLKDEELDYFYVLATDIQRSLTDLAQINAAKVFMFIVTRFHTRADAITADAYLEARQNAARASAIYAASTHPEDPDAWGEGWASACRYHEALLLQYFG